MQKKNEDHAEIIIRDIRLLTGLFFVFLLIITGLSIHFITGFPTKNHSEKIATTLVQSQLADADTLWNAPDTATLNRQSEDSIILYGRELISHTAKYFGPRGLIAASANGMNCQNCHLDAGTRPYGNNYGFVYATYPKFRSRSGTMETMERRVNDCFERSLNGRPLAEDSREMKAILAYFGWLGKNVPKGEKVKGSGLLKPDHQVTAADPETGKIIFGKKCESCHGSKGEGKIDSSGITYQYPPLWGENSYNIGAGLFRLSLFAGYVKANMPWGATHQATQLTDEEAWNVAAFVNSQPRPQMDLKNDWPDIAVKPYDHPFGPYADGFSEKQHKFGPFKPIVEAKQKKLK